MKELFTVPMTVKSRERKTVGGWVAKLLCHSLDGDWACYQHTYPDGEVRYWWYRGGSLKLDFSGSPELLRGFTREDHEIIVEYAGQILEDAFWRLPKLPGPPTL